MLDNLQDKDGWISVGNCDSDAAESFIDAMTDMQKPLAFKFTQLDNIDFLFKLHLENFAIHKKRLEYAASGERKVIV